MSTRCNSVTRVQPSGRSVLITAYWTVLNSITDQWSSVCFRLGKQSQELQTFKTEHSSFFLALEQLLWCITGVFKLKRTYYYCASWMFSGCVSNGSPKDSLLMAHSHCTEPGEGQASGNDGLLCTLHRERDHSAMCHYSHCTGPGTETGLVQQETMGPDLYPCLRPVWTFLHVSALSIWFNF